MEETPTFSIGVACEQITVGVAEIGDVSEGTSEVEEKGKLGTTDSSAGCGPKVKRRYVKRNMDYWNSRKLTSLDRKGKVAV